MMRKSVKRSASTSSSSSKKQSIPKLQQQKQQQHSDDTDYMSMTQEEQANDVCWKESSPPPLQKKRSHCTDSIKQSIITTSNTVATCIRQQNPRIKVKANDTIKHTITASTTIECDNLALLMDIISDDKQNHPGAAATKSTNCMYSNSNSNSANESLHTNSHNTTAAIVVNVNQNERDHFPCGIAVTSDLPIPHSMDNTVGGFGTNSQTFYRSNSTYENQVNKVVSFDFATIQTNPLIDTRSSQQQLQHRQQQQHTSGINKTISNDNYISSKSQSLSPIELTTVSAEEMALFAMLGADIHAKNMITTTAPAATTTTHTATSISISTAVATADEMALFAMLEADMSGKDMTTTTTHTASSISTTVATADDMALFAMLDADIGGNNMTTTTATTTATTATTVTHTASSISTTVATADEMALFAMLEADISGKNGPSTTAPAAATTTTHTASSISTTVATADDMALFAMLEADIGGKNMTTNTATTAATTTTHTASSISTTVATADEMALFAMLEADLFANDANKAKSGVLCNSSQTAVPQLPLPEVRCDRYIALDCTIDTHSRIKEVRCFKYDNLYDDSVHSAISVVYLTEDWFDTYIVGGDIFHIVNLNSSYTDSLLHATSTQQQQGLNQYKNQIESLTTLDNNNGLLIVHPDMLVSPTKIADSCSCPRRGVITERAKVYATSKPAVVGNLRHMFIETLMKLGLSKLSSMNQTELHCCVNRGTDMVSAAANYTFNHQYVPTTDIEGVILTCIRKYALDLYTVDVTDTDALGLLKDVVDATLQWAKASYISGTASVPSSAASMQSSSAAPPPLISYLVKQVISAEEVLWSPVLGIKGQIDIVARGTLQCCAGAALTTLNEDYVVPIEIKTGKRYHNTVVTHKAQVIMYILTLLVREKSASAHGLYGDSSSSHAPRATRHGLLLYLNELEVSLEVVVPVWFEVRALIAARNMLAINLKKALDMDKAPLPAMLKRPYDCDGCYQASECMVYHASIESGTAKSSGASHLFTYLTKHLSPSHLLYLKHWNMLLDLEAQATTTYTNQLWSIPSWERSKTGRCIGGMSIAAVDVGKTHGDAGSNAFRVILHRKKGIGNTPSTAASAAFTAGDVVVLSIEFSSSGSTDGVVDIEDLVSHRPVGHTLTNSHSVNAVHCKKPWSVTSVEPHVAAGTIVSISDGEVIIASNQQPSRLMQIMAQDCSTSASTSANWSIRIDPDDLGVNSIGTMRSNLLALFSSPHDVRRYAETKANKSNVSTLSSVAVAAKATPSSVLSTRPSGGGNARIRELLIDLVKPKTQSPESLPHDIEMFRPKTLSRQEYRRLVSVYQNYKHGYAGNTSSATGSTGTIAIGKDSEVHVLGGLTIYPGCDPWVLLEEYRRLNDGQRTALRNVLLADDYTILIGLPGTGKTSTMSLIIRALIARNETVLITSYTHSAVDNLLTKVVEAGVSPSFAMRLGSTEYVTKSLHGYVLDIHQLPSIGALEKMTLDVKLIACTALHAAKSPVVSRCKPDWCIVDEAGQMSQPTVIGALLHARKFILVGDDKQLPPLVISEEAARKGMDQSLLRRLSGAHPGAVSCLYQQYRMNEEIMHISNQLIYDHKMVCGMQSVAKQRLQLASYAHIQTEKVRHIPWLSACIDPDVPVIFLNTDVATATTTGTTGTATTTGSRALVNTNAVEVEVIRVVTQLLVDCGISTGDIGIISPFRSQVSALKGVLDSIHDRRVEVSTVDKYQGRDKDVIVLSAVRDMVNGTAGSLLRDWRRINVAITRAKKKLIIVGSVAILRQIPLLDEMVSLLHWMNRIIDLPAPSEC